MMCRFFACISLASVLKFMSKTFMLSLYNDNGVDMQASYIVPLTAFVVINISCCIYFRYDDGRLEVMALYSSFHIAQLQVGLAAPLRLGQAKTVKVCIYRM